MENNTNKPQVWEMKIAEDIGIPVTKAASFGASSTIIIGGSASFTWSLSGGYSSASISNYGTLSATSGSLKTYSVQNIPRWFSTSPAPGDHMCSPSNPGGYTQEGTLFKSYTTQAPGTFLGYDAEAPGVKPQATIGYVYPFTSTNSRATTTIYEKIDPNGGPPNGFGTIWTASSGGEGPYTGNGPNSGFKAPSSGYSVDTDIVFSGTATVTPSTTTSYTLTASGSAGSYSKTVVITVLDIPATIQYFRANDDSPSHDCFEGDLVTLSWSTFLSTYESASSATIDQGIGTVSIGKDKTYSLIAPAEDTTYKMTIVGLYDNAVLEAFVTINILTPDSTPDVVSFPSIENATTTTFYDSNIQTITGIAVPIEFDSTNGSTISVNGGAFVDGPVTVDENDTVKLRMESAAAYSTLKTASVFNGTTQSTWKITTKSEPSNLPNPYDFIDVQDALLETLVVSNTVTITGLSAATTVSSPTNNFQSSVDGGVFDTSVKNISNGQTLRLAYTTSNVLGDIASGGITVGSSALVDWQVQNIGTADSNPTYFDFVDKINQAAGTYIVSDILTITGINVASAVSITGIGDFRINGGAWVTTGNINNNQTLQLRLLSSTTPGEKVSTTCTIGNLSDLWQVFTTTSGDVIPDAFYFNDKDNQTPNTFVTSNAVLIEGITSPAPILISNGEFQIDGGAWQNAGTINNGETIRLRIQSSPNLDTSVSMSITIG